MFFESVWLGLQAFFKATAFNADIGAWNTARMTDMSSVCPHCHCVACMGGLRASALMYVGLAAVLTHTCAVLALASSECFAARISAPSSVGISVRH